MSLRANDKDHLTLHGKRYEIIAYEIEGEKVTIEGRLVEVPRNQGFGGMVPQKQRITLDKRVGVKPKP